MKNTLPIVTKIVVWNLAFVPTSSQQKCSCPLPRHLICQRRPRQLVGLTGWTKRLLKILVDDVCWLVDFANVGLALSKFGADHREQAETGIITVASPGNYRRSQPASTSQLRRLSKT